VPATFLSAGRRLLLAPLVLVCAALVGCFSSKDPNEGCDDVSEYQSSRSVPGIVVPEGLVAPSHSSAFVVPDGATSGDPEGARRGAACLARPPDFFSKDPAPAAR